MKEGDTSYLDIIRQGERDLQYNIDSSLCDYEEVFEGIAGFLHYVRLYPSAKTIIDVGAGSARAVNELADLEEASGLRFLATGLLAETNEYTDVGAVPYRVTEAEHLEGIDDASAGGILANYSITYTNNPASVARAIDRILVPGGILKTSLHDMSHFPLSRMHRVHVQTSSDYKPLFEAQGFDVATNRHLLYAIKPGLQTDISAEQLLQLDAFLYKPPQ